MISPPSPLDAVPVPMDIDPDEPDDAVPVLNISSPLTPKVPAFSVRSMIVRLGRVLVNRVRIGVHRLVESTFASLLPEHKCI